MDHFKGINETERFNNELLKEIKRSNQLLEQIAQLLQHKDEPRTRQPRKTKTN